MPVVSSFSCLQDIRFIDVNWIFLPKDSRDALSLHTFENIAFRSVDINTSDFYSLVSGSYDSLHRLKLDQTRVRPGPLECSVGSPLCIKNLSLKFSSFLSVLPSCLSLMYVHALDVLFHDFDELCSLQHFVISHAPRFYGRRCKVISYLSCLLTVCYDSVMHLSSSQHLPILGLLSLTVDLWDYRCRSLDLHLLKWWMENIRQCLVIERHTFYVSLEGLLNNYSVWRTLNDHLSDGDNPCLKAIVIHLNANSTAKGFAKSAK